jgi:hypothetical protein
MFDWMIFGVLVLSVFTFICGLIVFIADARRW